MVDFIEMSVKIVHWTRTTVEVLIEIFSFKGLKMLFYMYIVCTNKCSTGIRVKKDGDEKVRVYWHPLAVIFTPFWAHARLHTNWTLYDVKLCQNFWMVKFVPWEICHKIRSNVNTIWHHCLGNTQMGWGRFKVVPEQQDITAVKLDFVTRAHRVMLWSNVQYWATPLNNSTCFSQKWKQSEDMRLEPREKYSLQCCFQRWRKRARVVVSPLFTMFSRLFCGSGRLLI